MDVPKRERQLLFQLYDGLVNKSKAKLSKFLQWRILCQGKLRQSVRKCHWRAAVQKGKLMQNITTKKNKRKKKRRGETKKTLLMQPLMNMKNISRSGHPAVEMRRFLTFSTNYVIVWGLWHIFILVPWLALAAACLPAIDIPNQHSEVHSKRTGKKN